MKIVMKKKMLKWIAQVAPSAASSLFIILINWFSSLPTFPANMDWSNLIAIYCRNFFSIYAFLGKVEIFGNLTGAKYLTNSMSAINSSHVEMLIQVKFRAFCLDLHWSFISLLIVCMPARPSPLSLLTSPSSMSLS